MLHLRNQWGEEGHWQILIKQYATASECRVVSGVCVYMWGVCGESKGVTLNKMYILCGCWFRLIRVMALICGFCFHFVRMICKTIHRLVRLSYYKLFSEQRSLR